ncbi:unnamed protein product, partial [Sphenostylis stenocarpa]
EAFWLYSEAGQDLGSTAALHLPDQSTAGLLCRGDRLEGKGVDPLAQLPFRYSVFAADDLLGKCCVVRFWDAPLTR